jgi:hypothetical protein
MDSNLHRLRVYCAARASHNIKNVSCDHLLHSRAGQARMTNESRMMNELCRFEVLPFGKHLLKSAWHVMPFLSNEENMLYCLLFDAFRQYVV